MERPLDRKPLTEDNDTRENNVIDCSAVVASASPIDCGRDANTTRS